MSDCQCRGEGMFYDDDRETMVICACPAGYRRNEYLRMTADEKRKLLDEHKRRKRKSEDEVPF